MTLFQSKIGRKIVRQRENKNYRSPSSLPDTKLKNSKKLQKNSKIKKFLYGFISSQNRLEKAEKERK